jgi:hypothetical protein
MPMHDWTRVEAGIFHAFHHGWISSISDKLNTGLLPADYYALPEQIAAGFGPGVVTLQELNPDENTEVEFYRLKKSAVAVKHVSGDRTVAMVEIVSPGNKSNRNAFRALVDKACELLEYRIHLLIVDPFPPGKRDANGIHAAIWEEMQDDSFQLPADKPLTLAAYECSLITRAYVEPVAVGEALPDMPLFLAPGEGVMVPLEATYQTAFAVLPQRWRRVLENKEQNV